MTFGVICFALAFFILLLGAFLYSRVSQAVFAPKLNQVMPCDECRDGVDFTPLPTWKVFLIQLLNIAGLGPIFGALAGCLFGPVALIWIAFGAVLGGAVHDFMAALISIENKGENLHVSTGRYLGKAMHRLSLVVCILIMLIVGVVFTLGPAAMLHAIYSPMSIALWTVIIMLYYFAATILPIQSLIGRIYPFFGVLFLFMALSVLISFLLSDYPILPQLSFDNAGTAWSNWHPKESLSIWPMLFVTTACGAISGFHATMSPMMARCLKQVKRARPVFYGGMILEGAITLIWAVVGISFRELVTDYSLVSTETGKMTALAASEVGGELANFASLSMVNPGAAVQFICETLLGPVGAAIAVLGVVILPITSGDTALRCCRLMLADIFGLSQVALKNRLALALPIFIFVIIFTQIDFSIAWRYMGFLNQSLACITLWMISSYLLRRGRFHWITTLPAMMMTALCGTYFMCAPECLALPLSWSWPVGVAFSLSAFALFMWRIPRARV